MTNSFMDRLLWTLGGMVAVTCVVVAAEAYLVVRCAWCGGWCDVKATERRGTFMVREYECRQCLGSWIEYE